ncbi:dihydroneopterin aldolase [Candidatus Pantoea edessiphila]|uniref:7,8-dihydroneopterin aldolase n=1 Tax=Candidatus Pantoea edessiphila TaxID=2044610 RepID=A0A2P5T1S4_9GAMM|nr:dihydroneopterin aldolase [Candidatus Pantoea edessiphila]PPI88513.1 dihydroneopterin aldolase [Candidatus Pantoea edessiphila]
MDIIFIEQLVIFTTIGIYDWEKNIKQKLILDVEMMWDKNLSNNRDDIDNYLNYSDVSEAILTYLTDNHFLLIEKVAEGVANLLMKKFGCPGVYIKVSKPNAVAQAKQVGIKIKRGLFLKNLI